MASLDDATSKVIERLSDPARPEAHRSKGLVVGYVQSGKTANFTGVAAKAIDAGYRLIIILTGTVDLLREQTQRRFDMELVGEENILRGIDPHDPDLMRDVDYQQDEDWGHRFVKHGFLPSTHGVPDIIRLTGQNSDYKALQAGIVALEFEKSDRSKPLNDPVNLYSCNARVAIVKKNHTVLQKLVRDLKKAKTPLGEIPTLIIDDESDQASVNVSNPNKWKADTPEREERNAINRDISDLLGMLPRAQYIGYTATPFANVFIDPSDSENIFPTDFLISLQRPPGYMGVAAFHDLDPSMEGVEKTIANSNEKAHVRSLEANGNGEDVELSQALDAFVLTGAIKLYRQSVDKSISFRHHTMLIHQSVKQAEHKILAKKVFHLWKTAGFDDPAGTYRLKALYEADFLPVCNTRPDGPIPSSFADLKPFIGLAVARITAAGENPVIVVNGDKEITEDVSFDTRPVWRILLGGTKLSRGFTVEGLCITYYRRKTKQADTLMQMGRWFGFRRGYQDLVRLYIARKVADGKKTIDLYEAFEAIVRDEESFRSQLRTYSVLVDGKPQVTPRDIPPLVSQHLPWLRPTAKNKMFNARMVVRRITGSLVIPYGYPSDLKEREANYTLIAPLLAKAVGPTKQLKVPALKNVAPGTFDAYVGVVSHQEFVDALSAHTWIAPEYFDPEIKHLEELADDIDDWVLIMPQLETAVSVDLSALGQRSLFKRGIREGRNLWGEPTDRKHRPAAERLADAIASYGDEFIDGMQRPRRGAILAYPMYDGDKGQPSPATKSNVILALAWIVPTSAQRGGQKVVQFVARNRADERAPIVDKDD